MRICFALLILAAVLLVACGPAADETEQIPETTIQPAVTVEIMDSDAEGYPPPPVVTPSLEPYPGGLVFITRPIGRQCDDNPEADIGLASAELRDAHIPTANVEIIEMMVTTACGSPTSTHYRAQIGADYLGAAIELGWFPDYEEE